MFSSFKKRWRQWLIQPFSSICIFFFTKTPHVNLDIFINSDLPEEIEAVINSFEVFFSLWTFWRYSNFQVERSTSNHVISQALKVEATTVLHFAHWTINLLLKKFLVNLKLLIKNCILNSVLTGILMIPCY